MLTFQLSATDFARLALAKMRLPRAHGVRVRDLVRLVNMERAILDAEWACAHRIADQLVGRGATKAAQSVRHSADTDNRLRWEDLGRLLAAIGRKFGSSGVKATTAASVEDLLVTLPDIDDGAWDKASFEAAMDLQRLMPDDALHLMHTSVDGAHAGLRERWAMHPEMHSVWLKAAEDLLVINGYRVGKRAR
jgi:hypothetical protein